LFSDRINQLWIEFLKTSQCVQKNDWFANTLLAHWLGASGNPVMKGWLNKLNCNEK